MRKEGEPPPLAPQPCPAGPARQSSPAQPSRDGLEACKENWCLGGGASAARRTGAPGCRRRCCVMVPTWTPAFCPPSRCQRRRTPELREAGFGVRNPHDRKGNRAKGWAMRLPRLLSSPSPKHFNFFSPSRLRPGKSEGGEGRRLHEPPRVAAEPLFSPLGQKRHRGPKSPPCPNPRPLPAPAAKYNAPESSFSPQLPNTRSPCLACKRVSSKGQKALLFFLLTRSARCHGV